MHEGSLVLAVAEPAGEHGLHRVGLEAVDPELQRHVPRPRHHVVVHGADAPLLVASGDAAHRLLGGGAHLVGDAQLVLHQAPVEARDALPVLVGRHVHVREQVAGARHRRLRHHARDVARRPALPGAAIGQLALGVAEPRERRRRGVEATTRRTQEHVVRDPLARVSLQVLEVAEVVGEEVGARIVDALHHLEHVAGLQLGEPDHPRAQVVVHRVPGLAHIALAVAPALHHRAVLAHDAGALDAHHLPVRGVLHRLPSRLVHAARGERAQHQLAGARREPVGEDARDGEVRQDLHVLALRGARRLGQRGRVVEVRRGVLLLGPHRAHQLAQRGILRLERQRLREGRQRPRVVALAQAVAPDCLVHVGPVRGKLQQLGIGAVGLGGAAVL